METKNTRPIWQQSFYLFPSYRFHDSPAPFASPGMSEYLFSISLSKKEHLWISDIFYVCRTTPLISLLGDILGGVFLCD